MPPLAFRAKPKGSASGGDPSPAAFRRTIGIRGVHLAIATGRYGTIRA